MARDLFLNGEVMVSVRGNANDPTIGTVQQLGLAENGIPISLGFKHRDVHVDAWGPETPVDVQTFLSDATIRMSLVHIDRTILDACLLHSMGNVGGSIGSLPHAGQRLGNNAARFANNYITLYLSSPIAGKPWRFFYTYLTGQPFEQSIGVERSIFTLNWRAIPYTNDPWGGGSAQPATTAGTGALGAQLWDAGAVGT